MEQQEKEAQEFVDKVYSFAANLMFEQEKSATETKRILVEEGLREEDAEVVVTNLQNQLQQAKSEAGNKNMLYGALWCIGGLVVTALTYSAASNGGTYVVAWGAVLFGAIQFFKGVWQKISK